MPEQAGSINLSDFQNLLETGIHDVQEAMAPRFGFLNPNAPRTELETEQAVLGLSRLTLLQHELGSTGIMPLATVEEVFDREPYPKAPVVEHALVAVACSPVADYSQKAALTRTWVEASSSGRGRTYPVRLVARHMAASILEELSVGGLNRDLWRLSGDIDKDFWSVKALKRLNGSKPVQAMARRHFTNPL